MDVWSGMGPKSTLPKTPPRLLLGMNRTPILATPAVANILVSLVFWSAVRKWNPFNLLKLIRLLLCRVLTTPLIISTNIVEILVWSMAARVVICRESFPNASLPSIREWVQVPPGLLGPCGPFNKITSQPNGTIPSPPNEHPLVTNSRDKDMVGVKGDWEIGRDSAS